jgi:hypothetical protein
VILNLAEVDLEEAEVGASRAPIVKLMIHVREKMTEYLQRRQMQLYEKQEAWPPIVETSHPQRMASQ